MKSSKAYTVFIHAFFIILTLVFLIPFVAIVLISFSNEADILDYGYSFIPRHFSTLAYQTLFQNFTAIARSIILTIIAAVLHPALSVAINTISAYALAQKNFAFRKPIMWYITITAIFHGGLIPTYIINTNLYGLHDTPLVYLIFGLASLWNVVLFRTFFSQIPLEMIESAQMDGATQFQIFKSIVLPMSKPIMATLYFLGVLGTWNSWETSQMYIENPDFYLIQYVLQKILGESQFLRNALMEGGLSIGDTMPVETLRFAMCVIAVVPIFALFPYIQKFYAKGLTAGSVKG